MRSSLSIRPRNDAERSLREADEQEIDALSGGARIRYLRRIDRTLGLVREIVPPPASVVEIGCAQGNMSLLLAEAGYSTIAIDLRPSYLEYSRLKWERGCVRWVAGNAEALPLPDRSVDVALVAELLEHCAYPERALREARRVTKVGGLVLVTTPNGAYFRSRLPGYEETRRHASDLAIAQFEPDADGHVLLFRPDELRTLMTACGLPDPRREFYGSVFLSDRVAGRLPAAVADRLDDAVHRVPFLAERLSLGLCYSALRTT